MGNDNKICVIPNELTESKKVMKNWGYELIIHNGDGYCGKILHFYKNSEFSLHFHIQKHETWYVNYGKLKLMAIDTCKGNSNFSIINSGDIIVVPQGVPHQLHAIEESEIFEVSTPDDVKDSYRIWKGVNTK